MMNLPAFISLTFLATVLLMLLLFHRALVRAVGHRRAVLISAGLAGWVVLQSALSFSGFYQKNLQEMPPRFVLLVAPPLLVIGWVLISSTGRAFADRLPLAQLTYLSVVRIPVEIVLYWLFLEQTIPELMTFAGRNFDILAGITAPLVAYFGIQRRTLGRKAIIAWNVVALGLLLFIVGNAVLSTPTPLQRFAFTQPNVAIFYFPFALLPAAVVPLVLLAHLASLRQLWLASGREDRSSLPEAERLVS